MQESAICTVPHGVATSVDPESGEVPGPPTPRDAGMAGPQGLANSETVGILSSWGSPIREPNPTTAPEVSYGPTARTQGSTPEPTVRAEPQDPVPRAPPGGQGGPPGAVGGSGGAPRPPPPAPPPW